MYWTASGENCLFMVTLSLVVDVCKPQKLRLTNLNVLCEDTEHVSQIILVFTNVYKVDCEASYHNLY